MNNSRPGRKTPWAWAVATFFGAGLGKPGPGTWGSVGAVLMWAAYAWIAQPTPRTLFFALLAGIAASIALGVPAATIAARESGRHDPQFVVIDEAAGQWIALLGSRADLRHALLALILFRFFDITKPFPARRLESLPEGWGIVVFAKVSASSVDLICLAPAPNPRLKKSSQRRASTMWFPPLHCRWVKWS
jgi:phosphatidylglycerophosphatase A